MTRDMEHPNTRVFMSDDPLAIREALDALERGQVVGLPTDTVYGVGGDPWRTDALDNLYWAKRRPKSMAIPVLLSCSECVAKVACDLPRYFDALVQRFWPGGLTLVVPRRPGVPDLLSGGMPTVAVRMPDHAVALRLISGFGGALAVTSANISGRPSPTTAEQVLNDLRGRIAVLIDDGECPGGVASSLVDLTTNPPTMLREGALSFETLSQVVPGLVRASR
jgi:L-threonylcarbamoyladenylate synthase